MRRYPTSSESVTEDEYRHRYNDLTDRFRAEEKKHKRLTEKYKRMVTESVAIGGMLLELTELEAPPIEFDEKLWHAVVDRVTVYNDDRLVYSPEGRSRDNGYALMRIEKVPKWHQGDAVRGFLLLKLIVFSKDNNQFCKCCDSSKCSCNIWSCI